MASFVGFEAFPEAVAEEKHNFASDTIKVALCAAANAPSAASDAVLTDITTVSTTNLDTITLPSVTSTRSGGTYTLDAGNLTMTATGAVGAFRYVVLYNDSATNKDLICYYDYGSEIPGMSTDETFTISFAVGGILTIS